MSVPAAQPRSATDVGAAGQQPARPAGAASSGRPGLLEGVGGEEQDVGVGAEHRPGAGAQPGELPGRPGVLGADLGAQPGQPGQQVDAVGLQSAPASRAAVGALGGSAAGAAGRAALGRAPVSLAHASPRYVVHGGPG